jgi:hypothetical protein
MKKDQGDAGKGTKANLKLISSQGDDDLKDTAARDYIEDMAEALDEPILIADGFDEAIIGYSDSWSGNDGRCLKAVYDRKKCIEILMRDMSEMEAEEYFEFNVAGAYVGPHTPLYVETFDDNLDKRNSTTRVR